MAVFGRQLRVSPERAEMAVARLDNAGDGREPPPTPGAINLDNILKLIPGEVVALYVTGKGIARTAAVGNPDGSGTSAPVLFWQAHWLAICFWVCLATCAAVRVIASKPVGQIGLLAGVNWSLVIVTLLAFFIWAHAVSEIAPVIPGFTGAYAGFFAMIFGIFAPKLVRAE